MKQKAIQRMLSDIKNSKKLFGLPANLVKPLDIPSDFADDYCIEFYPFYLYDDVKARITYYKDFRNVMRMELAIKPAILSKELVKLRDYSVKFKSSKKDIIVLLSLLDNIRVHYRFNDKFLSLSEVKKMWPLHTDFISYEDDVKSSIKVFMNECITPSKQEKDFDEFDSNLEMFFISLYRLVLYGIYTLPVDKKFISELEKIISKYQKKEK